MKIHNVPQDNKLHTCCIRCQREMVRSTRVRGQLSYHCAGCGTSAPRALVFDPSVKWWVDHENEYWHETAGIFVRNTQGKFLFFNRTNLPFGLTMPAGHVGRKEAPEVAARRELREETGLALPRRAFRQLATVNIYGDECHRGADVHRWHLFLVKVREGTPITLNQEGTQPIWLALDAIPTLQLTLATRYLILHYGIAAERR